MSTDPEPTGGQTQPDKPSQRPPGAGKPTPESIPAGERAPGAPVPPLMHKTPWTAYIKPAAWTLAAIYVIVFVGSADLRAGRNGAHRRRAMRGHYVDGQSPINEEGRTRRVQVQWFSG